MPELKLDNSIVDDRYLIERCLGRGSYAEIFIAYDQQREGHPVIIKALNTTLQGTPDPDLDSTLVENFQNEAIALDKVRHPNIIRRLGHGTAADLRGVPFHYLVLEYMPGGDLLVLCRKQPLSLNDALIYFKQVADALAYAHSRAVIHRDIKPNNLLLSEDCRTVKIADFGVAKMTPGETDEITRVGTNVYAPPEHHPDSSPEEISQRLTPSADIYSLAKTIYTAMTGRAPRQFARQPITQLPAELAGEKWGDGLLAVLEKATSASAADRYQSAQEFWDDFARLPLEGEQDEEATVVRSRLGSAGAVERAAARPNFHALASAPLEDSPQKARIVVEIPQHAPAVAPEIGSASLTAQAAVSGRSSLATADRAVTRTGAKAIKKAEPTFFDNFREFISSDWMRRAFIVFLLFALVGLGISTYYHFSTKRIALPSWLGSNQKTGTITDPGVYLRKDPGGARVGALPKGTRVRVLESSGNWSRVEVIEWPGPKPDNSLESGWAGSEYIKLD